MNPASPLVLVVESERALSRIIGMTLREAGFRSIEVNTGAAALAALTEQMPDAVVLDLGLPDGRSRDVLDQLSRLRDLQDSGTSLVVISVLNWEDANKTYGLQGVPVPFLVKPFNPWELVRILSDRQMIR